MYPQQYRLTPAAYNAARKRILVALPILMVLFTAPFAIYWFINPVSRPMDWGKIWAICGVIVVFISIRLVRLLQKQKIAYDEFVITIDGNRITGKNLLHQDIDFAFIEVTQIVKHIDGSYIIVAGPQNTAINIPADVENRQQLEDSLNSISPIMVNPVNWFTRYYKALLVAVFAILITFIYSRSKIIIGVSTPILVVVFTWLFFNMRNINEDKKSTKTIKQWLGFAVIIVAVLAKAFFVLSGRY